MQITAARHAVKPNCGVGVAAVGNTCRHILVVVGDQYRCAATVAVQELRHQNFQVTELAKVTFPLPSPKLKSNF